MPRPSRGMTGSGGDSRRLPCLGTANDTRSRGRAVPLCLHGSREPNSRGTKAGHDELKEFGRAPATRGGRSVRAAVLALAAHETAAAIGTVDAARRIQGEIDH